MSLTTAKDFFSSLGVSPVTGRKKVEQEHIPFFKRGNKVDYFTNVMDIISMRGEIKKCEEGSIIVFGNNKGGVGKTTVASNIGATLSHYGYNVLLVDWDIQSNLTFNFGKSVKTHNIINVVLGQEKLQDCIFSYLHDRVFGKLDILGNDFSMVDEYNDIEGDKLAFLEGLKKEYDFILIDTPPTIYTKLESALLCADYFVAVLKPDSFSQDGVVKFMKSFDKVKIKNQQLKVLGGIISIKNNRSSNDLSYSETITKNFMDITDSEIIGSISSSSVINEIIGGGAMVFQNYKHNVAMQIYTTTNQLVESYIVDLYKQGKL